MTLACGYGRPVPSNRFLASRQDGALDVTPAFLAMYNAAVCDVMAGCGSCGACKSHMCGWIFKLGIIRFATMNSNSFWSQTY